jgi:hypothetical protein
VSGAGGRGELVWREKRPGLCRTLPGPALRPPTLTRALARNASSRLRCSGTSASAGAELAAILRALQRATARVPAEPLAAAAAAGPLLPGLLAALQHAPWAAVRRGAVLCLADLSVRLGDRCARRRAHAPPPA